MMAYVRARTARWTVVVSPRVESGPVGVNLPERTYEITVTDSGAYFLLDKRHLDGSAPQPGPADPTDGLPRPQIRANGWWYVPRLAAEPGSDSDSDAEDPPAATTVNARYPALGPGGKPGGAVPIVVHLDGGRAVVGGVALSAVQFARYIRRQPGWGRRDLILFASGAGTRARVEGVRAERSFARELRDELGVAVTAPRGRLIRNGTTWVSGTEAAKGIWPRLPRRVRRTGFKYYPRTGHHHVRMPHTVDAVLRALAPFPPVT
jgi:hypothetical protein